MSPQRSFDYFDHPSALPYAIASFILMILGQVLIFAVAPRYEVTNCIRLQLLENCTGGEATYYQLLGLGIATILVALYLVLKTIWHKPIPAIKALIAQSNRVKWWMPVKVEVEVEKTRSSTDHDKFHA